jgi:Glycosyl transferases group 1
MKVLMWHVHGSWTTTFVHGPVETVVPVAPGRGPDGLGLPTTYSWPSAVQERPLDALAMRDIDVVVLQRPQEQAWLLERTGLRAGVDVPAVYLEHNTPPDPRGASRHPLADQRRIPIVHVTHFNALMWDNGPADTAVIEHGVLDSGLDWRGGLPRGAVVVNEPVRRGRVTGTDLIPLVAGVCPVDIFGMQTAGLTDASTGGGIVGHGDVPQRQLMEQLVERRVYVHLCRWTSLGLSLLEAMELGMPTVALATTEASEALADSGVVLTNRPDRLVAALTLFIHDHAAAAAAGRKAREHVRRHYSASRFHADWMRLLEEVSR